MNPRPPRRTREHPADPDRTRLARCRGARDAGIRRGPRRRRRLAQRGVRRRQADRGRARGAAERRLRRAHLAPAAPDHGGPARRAGRRRGASAAGGHRRAGSLPAVRAARCVPAGGDCLVAPVTPPSACAAGRARGASCGRPACPRSLSGRERRGGTRSSRPRWPASPGPDITPPRWRTSPRRPGCRRERRTCTSRARRRRSPRRVLHAVAAGVAEHVLAETQTCRVLLEARALAAHEPAIAAAVRAADARTHQQLEALIAAGVQAGEWPAGTDPALAARLFTAGLYGLMAQWHLAPGSFSWEAAAAALAGGVAPGAAAGVSLAD